jgi:PAS domain S-box-containing protein
LLVADLASALRLDRTFIGLCHPEAPDRVSTLAAHLHGQAVGNFEYMVKGSPCECILAGEICVFASGIQPQFPEDLALVEQGWDSYAGAPIRNAAGDTIGVLAVMHSQPMANPDLVKSLLQVFSERASAELERKRVEQELRNSEQRFSAIFHSSPVAMSVSRFGKDHAMVDVNKAFERLYLMERSAVVGKSDIELGVYANDAERKAINKAIKAKGYIDRYETWIKRGDGSKALFMLSGNTFELAGEKFVIFTGEDVTEKHDIENEVLELNETLEERVIERTEELQQANQELESTLDTLNMAQEELVRSEKLAALGALVAGIAHELNTPIGNSLMVASTLVDRTRALSKNFQEGLKRSLLEQYIGDASKAGDILERNLSRAANLVTRFKQVAVDQTSSQRREFSLAEVVAEIILTLSPTIKKTYFAVEQDIPEDLMMDSYPGPLGQVLTNLINNAFLHGFEGRNAGIVMIEAQSVGDDYIELTIRDNGIGIPPANLNRIFDPFFTTKLGAGGSGLGLPITHNIVSSVLGGRIRLQSEVDVGTTFVLVLPLTAPQIQPEEEAPKPSSSIKSFLG